MKKILLTPILEKIIFESEHLAFKAYWLDPHGNFHQVYVNNSSEHGHWDFAKKYIKTNFPEINSDNVNVIRVLFRKKWIRVTYNYYHDNTMNIEYQRNDNPLTNPNLKRAIFKKMEELGAKVLHDDIRKTAINIEDL